MENYFSSFGVGKGKHAEETKSINHKKDILNYTKIKNLYSSKQCKKISHREKIQAADISKKKKNIQNIQGIPTNNKK